MAPILCRPAHSDGDWSPSISSAGSPADQSAWQVSNGPAVPASNSPLPCSRTGPAGPGGYRRSSPGLSPRVFACAVQVLAAAQPAARLSVHIFPRAVAWLVLMLESNTCSCRSPLSGDARSRDAPDRTLQKGCAVAITNSSGTRDHCDRCLRDVEATLRAASKAAGTWPSTEDSARRTPAREGRASPYAPFGPSTARRVPADLMAAPNLVRPEASAQATPRSTTVAARWPPSSNPRLDATFLAARNAISHSGTARDTGDSCG